MQRLLREGHVDLGAGRQLALTTRALEGVAEALLEQALDEEHPVVVFLMDVVVRLAEEDKAPALEVGLQPVEVDDVSQHVMEAERFEVPDRFSWKADSS